MPCGGPRFKIDRYGDWKESYPTADYSVSANTSYKIGFDSTTKVITATAVSSCDSVNPSTQWFFRGNVQQLGDDGNDPAKQWSLLHRADLRRGQHQSTFQD